MDEITCTHCGKQVKLTEAFKHQFEQHIAESLKGDFERERTDAVQKALAKARDEGEHQLKNLEEERNEIREQNKRQSEQLLELNRSLRALNVKDQQRELQMQTRLREELSKMREELSKQLSEEQRFKVAEKEKQLQDALKVNEDLRRKLEQASQQLQGEVAELNFEKTLKEKFRFDEIKPVEKGFTGADILQQVFDEKNVLCGTIIWEVKRTQNWSDGWIQKLKDDRDRARASIAILVTQILPKNIKNFGRLNGVWITNFTSYLDVAGALRFTLLSLAQQRQAEEGKHSKMEMMYRYLSGTEFKQRVEAIVEAFIGLRAQLERERRAMTKLWNEREKQIERAQNNTIGLYGDVRGIIGGKLPEIKTLELEQSEEEDETHEQDGREQKLML
jgi:hypothetical protein